MSWSRCLLLLALSIKVRKGTASLGTNLILSDRDVHGERKVGVHFNLAMFAWLILTRLDFSSGGFMGGK